MGLIVGRVDRSGVEDLRYTLEKALETTEFWKDKFSGVNAEEITPKDLAELTDRVTIEPHDLYRTSEIWPDYIRDPKIFYTVMRTSGTTGRPKRVPYTRDDRMRSGRQLEPWIREYMDKGDRIASFFPPLPSSSGMFAFGGFEAINAKTAYYQVPIQYLLDREMLLRELQDIKPTSIFCLTATAYNLGLTLPESIKKDIQTIVVGGETLTPELARATLELFENAVIIDNFGSTEDAVTGYRVITRKKATKFSFGESIVVLKDNGDGYDDYKRIYITKVMRDGELTGLPLFNYDIGDLARIENGEVRNIIRIKDVVTLAGAKLHIDQVMEIVYDHPDLLDFVIIYHPLSPENPKPKATIRIAYGEKKPAGIEDEVRELLYEANNPVRYEVEESQQAELEIVAVPLEKLRADLPRRLGKTKRIYIVGKDL
ncbi:long-chain fatty acid--CoA ligase [Thermococcus sp. 18S1]|uniref:phenylacetate--CoA ligase family protein n=1 Tax=Thermococcus sp. 18S1 TaxID=1638210 RepID=UPI00143BDAEF|nr:AMP-binding protein [Thermococcus sp. 18S1]NJE31194.1 long-chain fatty acid--CoA ligase [Thermococcus sp. 18S1]